MIGYIPCYDKMSDDAVVEKYLRVDTDKLWAGMTDDEFWATTRWVLPGLCAKRKKRDLGGLTSCRKGTGDDLHHWVG